MNVPLEFISLLPVQKRRIINMRVIQIDKISFRCRIDDDIPWVDQVEINGVWVNPEEWLSSHRVMELDSIVREIYLDQQEERGGYSD